MAGREGIEPPSSVLETIILPLYYRPMVLTGGSDPPFRAYQARVLASIRREEIGPPPR